MKLNQEDFGSLLGITKATVSRYETGVAIPPLDTLTKISSVANVSLDWLLYGDREKAPFDDLHPDLPTPSDQSVPFEYVPPYTQLLSSPDHSAEKVSSHDEQFSDKLLYEIVLKLEQRLADRKMALSPPDKAIIIVHLYQLHRNLAIPVSLKTIDAHIDLRAVPLKTAEQGD